MRFKSGSWCTSIYSSLIKWTTIHGQQEQILARWSCFSDHLQHEGAFTDDIGKTPVANKEGFFPTLKFLWNSNVFIAHPAQSLTYDDIRHCLRQKNANHRVTVCQEEMRPTGKTKRDKKGEKWRMKMKENFPSWPGKLLRIGNRCPTTVTLSEKTLKVLLVWGEGESKDLKSAAADRRDPEGNPLCWGMCGGKEWESVL